MTMRRLLLGISALVTVTACSPHYQRTEVGYSWDKEAVDIREIVEDACDDLMGDAREIDKEFDKFLVVSFANLDEVETSSPLGRLMGQQCGSEIVDKGYQVTELLLAETVYIDPAEGEFLLSRDLEQLAAKHDATMVVVGTYTTGIKTIYVTAKVVRSADARIMGARNFELPMTSEVRALLGRVAN